MSLSTILVPAPARAIDPRGQRFGAGVSAVILALGFIQGLPWLATLMGANLLVAAMLGTRLFIPGRAWPLVRRTLRLEPVEPEHEYPPRFAQALGGIGLALATAAFLLGATTVGWVLAAAVGGLQSLLAVTGICVGCRLYFLRWWAPSLFARLFRRTDGLRALEVQALKRIN
jgi:hypothetical protein